MPRTSPIPDERRPILVGAAQLTERDAGYEDALEPVEMLARVGRAAALDAGLVATSLEALDTVAIVDPIGWRCRNPARLQAEALGAKPARELRTGLGGEMPVALLNELAGRIASGRSRMALLSGCHNVRSLMQARRAGRPREWQAGGPDLPEPEIFRVTRPGVSDLEKHYGLVLPPQIYPLFENALRRHWGLGLAEHRAWLGRLFEPFTRVAARNPHAWFRTPRSAEELTTPSARNRMICFPYTKYLNAVMETDQAAALLLTSVAEARRRGIAEERWVHWRGGADAVERAWWASERPDHAACPAMQAVFGAALARAGLALDEIDRFDLYSCFPSAVGMACEMSGLAPDDPRGLTVTGGLPYAGGPGNDYCTHAIATMMDELRAGRGTNGLVTGNGWYLTKHAASVLSTTPADLPLAPADAAPPSAELPTEPVSLVPEAAGRATIETYTVFYGRENDPERGIVVGRLADGGARFLAHTPDDRATLEALVSREAIGLPGRVRHHDGHNRFDLL